MQARAIAYDAAHERIAEAEARGTDDYIKLAEQALSRLQNKLDLAGAPDFRKIEVHID